MRAIATYIAEILPSLVRVAVPSPLLPQSHRQVITLILIINVWVTRRSLGDANQDYRVKTVLLMSCARVQHSSNHDDKGVPLVLHVVPYGQCLLHT